MFINYSIDWKHNNVFEVDAESITLIFLKTHHYIFLPIKKLKYFLESNLPWIYMDIHVVS